MKVSIFCHKNLVTSVLWNSSLFLVWKDSVLVNAVLPRVDQLLREVKLNAPDGTCLSPIGEYNLRLGIMKEYSPDLVATYEGPVCVNEGHPFVVECGICVGGATSSIPVGIAVHRFANRIPMLFENGSDVMTLVATKQTNWGAYKLRQTVDRIGVFLSIVSTKIPFKGTGKECIGNDVLPIREAVRSAIRACCLQLKSKLSARSLLSSRTDRMKKLSLYVPDAAKAFHNFLVDFADMEAARVKIEEASKGKKKGKRARKARERADISVPVASFGHLDIAKGGVTRDLLQRVLRDYLDRDCADGSLDYAMEASEGDASAGKARANGDNADNEPDRDVAISAVQVGDESANVWLECVDEYRSNDILQPFRLNSVPMLGVVDNAAVQEMCGFFMRRETKMDGGNKGSRVEVTGDQTTPSSGGAPEEAVTGNNGEAGENPLPAHASVAVTEFAWHDANAASVPSSDPVTDGRDAADGDTGDGDVEGKSEAGTTLEVEGDSGAKVASGDGVVNGQETAEEVRPTRVRRSARRHLIEIEVSDDDTESDGDDVANDSGKVEQVRTQATKTKDANSSERDGEEMNNGPLSGDTSLRRATKHPVAYGPVMVSSPSATGQSTSHQSVGKSHTDIVPSLSDLSMGSAPDDMTDTLGTSQYSQLSLTDLSLPDSMDDALHDDGTPASSQMSAKDGKKKRVTAIDRKAARAHFVYRPLILCKQALHVLQHGLRIPADKGTV